MILNEIATMEYRQDTMETTVNLGGKTVVIPRRELDRLERVRRYLRESKWKSMRFTTDPLLTEFYRQKGDILSGVLISKEEYEALS